MPFREYSTNANTKPYSANILRDAYINIADHPVVSDFFRNTEKVTKNKRRRRTIKSAKQILLKNLEAYREKFANSCKEKKMIPKMEIADITFWMDYIENHKRVKRKIGEIRQKQMKS